MESLECYETWEAFKKAFSKYGTSIKMLRGAQKDIENLSLDGLRSLTYQLYNKWSESSRRQTLIIGIKRKVQANFYEQLYGKQPSEAVIKLDKIAESLLCLSDKQPGFVKQQTTEDGKVTKPKTYKNEFSKKIAGLGLDEVIKWALEIGVPQEKIDKHKGKQLGLAKMNISNMIRAKLK